MGAEKRLKLRLTASESDESTNIQKIKHACVVEAHESTRKRLDPTPMKITSQVKDTIRNQESLHFGDASSDEISDAKAAVDREWEKLEKLPAWQLNNVKSKKEVFLEAQRNRKESPLCCIDGHLSPQKNEELEPKYQKYEGRIVL